jgi:hypothetical protein
MPCSCFVCMSVVVRDRSVCWPGFAQLWHHVGW